MKTAEYHAPHNPDGRTLAPGYRWLSKGETINLETDQTTKYGGSVTPQDWVRLDQMADSEWEIRRVNWSVRRPLCVDDPHAPPPSEWAIPGWAVVSPGESSYADNGWQVWSQRLEAVGFSWQSIPFTIYIASTNQYYRRPIAAAQSRPCGEVPFGAEQECRLPKDSDRWTPVTERTPSDVEVSAGIWVWYGAADSPWAEFGYGYLSAATHWCPGRPPAPPKSVLPAPPKIDGAGGRSYTMEYTKNAGTVQFGCAVIALQFLRAADAMLTTSLDHPSGNRHIAGLTLNSGVSITSAEVAAILAYVDAVNKT